MKVGTFDKIGGAAIIAALGYTAFAATSWDWFPDPNDWSQIARIPKGMGNYIALLLPLVLMLVYVAVRHRCFGEGRKEPESDN